MPRPWGRVAPHAGAWIETLSLCLGPWHSSVAPHAGAWIETPDAPACTSKTASPPTRGRGLKQLWPPRMARVIPVAPHAGAWIETTSLHRILRLIRSPPTRGRGLKQSCRLPSRRLLPSPPTRGRGLKPHSARDSLRYWKSPPTRGRGLKPCQPSYPCQHSCVAPHAGAWIETRPYPQQWRK